MYDVIKLKQKHQNMGWALDYKSYELFIESIRQQILGTGHMAQVSFSPGPILSNISGLVARSNSDIFQVAGGTWAI